MKINQLNDLIDNLTYALKWSPCHERADYVHGYMAALRRVWTELADHCEDFPPKMRKPTEDELKEFVFEGQPVEGILEYRGMKLPIYEDDNGQCYFCQYPDGTITSGGTFEPNPEGDFVYCAEMVYNEKVKEGILPKPTQKPLMKVKEFLPCINEMSGTINLDFAHKSYSLLQHEKSGISLEELTDYGDFDIDNISWFDDGLTIRIKV